MARERWFYALDNKRRGPVSLQALVESLVTQRDPRTCIVWRRGLTEWTKASEIPEVSERLSPFLAETMRRRAPSEDEMLAAMGRAPRAAGAPQARVAPAPVVVEAPPPQSRTGIYVAAAAVVVAVVGTGVFFAFRGSGPSASPGPAVAGSGGASTGANFPPVATGGRPTPGGPPQPPAPVKPGGGPAASAGPTPAVAATGPQAGSSSGAEDEADLPPAEIAKLRGVAGWSGSKLTVTLFNGTDWRVTELRVRTSRLEKDSFIDAPQPYRLLAVQKVDAPVAQILERVAPERRKPFVNPLDTGPFEAEVGPHPEAYRWKIEGARGYPPR